MGMGGGGGIGGGPGGGFEGPSTSSGGGGCCGDVCLPEHVGAVPLDGEIQRGDLTGDRYGRYGRQEQGQEWCMCVFDVYVESIDLSSIPSPPSAFCLAPLKASSVPTSEVLIHHLQGESWWCRWRAGMSAMQQQSP